MIAELLQFAFQESGDISSYKYNAVGNIALSDSKACNELRSKAICAGECNETILNIKSTTEVCIIQYDSWWQNDVYNHKEKCDYIIYDTGLEKKRFAFCELTCTIEKYVNSNQIQNRIGKRAKAFNQMRATLKDIMDNPNPVAGVNILQYQNKAGIFGWRDRNITINNQVTKSLNGFISTPGSTSNIKEYKEYLFGNVFTFLQVKYPVAYRWD